MKLLTYSLFLALPLCGQNVTRFAGIYNALDYAYGVPGSSPGGLKVSVGNVATGAQTITLDFGYTTLSDGTKIYPLSANAPITVGSERVTPSSITCLSPNNYSTCQIRATFSQLHGPGDNVASGTYGLQEAINAAATLGGAIVVDGKWTVSGGTQGMIDAATVPANTAINDNRQGQVFGSGSGGSGTVTSITASAPLTGGTITHSGTIGCQAASGSQAGCLSAADYSAFTGKQPAGNYITALSGDGTASGPGSAALTLATVNSNIGACGDATHTSQITLDAKGRATSCTPVSITASSGITALTGDVTATGPGSVAATLATSGVTPTPCGDTTHSCSITVDAKGRVLSIANNSIAASGFTIGTNGTLLFSGGILDTINSVVPRLTNTSEVQALWLYDIGQDWAEQASGTTPGAGKIHPYANTDGTPHYVTPDGADHAWTGGSAKTWIKGSTSAGTLGTGGVDISWNQNDASNTGSAITHSTSVNPERFTASVAGYYSGSCAVYGTMTTTDGSVEVILNDGSDHVLPHYVVLASNQLGVAAPFSVHMSVGDYVRCNMFSSNTVTITASSTYMIIEN